MSTISKERLEEKRAAALLLTEYKHEDVRLAAQENVQVIDELLALRKEREAAVPVYQERRFHVSGKKQIEYWAEINKGAYQYLPESERRIVYAAPPAQPVAVLRLPEDVPDLINLTLEQQTEFNRGFWYGVEKVKRLNATAAPAPGKPVAETDTTTQQYESLNKK